MYIPVKTKLTFSLILSFCWVFLAIYLAIPWVGDLTTLLNSQILSWFIVGGIAIVPGFANSFIISALLMDNRPLYKIPKVLPDISVLVVAYNEEKSIIETLESVAKQMYPGHVHIIVIDDGSKDATEQKVNDLIPMFAKKDNFTLHFRKIIKNRGKSGALNHGLQYINTDLMVTIDADTHLFKDALAHIASNITEGPTNTAAVAGTILVNNSRKNYLTKLQEWDFFQGIGVVKRAQSLFQGTLVAQGAFSVYKTNIIKKIGGWCEDSVGEDIVLTWALREKGYRVAYAENAFAFTNIPETYWQFFKQRERWSIGLVEAFRKYPKVIIDLKKNSPFIYINLLFPYTDLMFIGVFTPGLIAALFFNWYVVVGLMTILLLPLAIIMNGIMFTKQKNIFKEYGLHVRGNILDFLIYMLTYQFFLIPATVTGYYKEMFKLGIKSWGTK